MNQSRLDNSATREDVLTFERISRASEKSFYVWPTVKYYAELVLPIAECELAGGLSSKVHLGSDFGENSSMLLILWKQRNDRNRNLYRKLPLREHR